MIRRSRSHHWLLFVLAALGAGCAENPPPSTELPSSDTTAAAAAAGQEPESVTGRPRRGGFLDRDDVTVRMAGSGLIVDIIPMNAEVIELATDDLRTFLQEAFKKVPDTVPPDLRRQGTLFLIGFSATEKEIPFEPSQVRLETEGRQYYPRYIVPVTANFERRVLRILEAPVWAVYIYDAGIDLLSTLEFAYQADLETGGAWRQVVQNVEEARSRAGR